MELAVEEINAKGGVNGKKIELITRDDNANPGDAVRVAEELVSREKIDVLTGTFLSNTGLARGRLRQAEEVLLPGRRAADRQDDLAGRQRIHLPPAPRHLHAGRDAGARGRQAQEEALGHRVPQLRIRPVGRGRVQDAAEGRAARRRVRRRAGAAAGQGRRRQRGAGAGRCQARRDLQRAVRRRPVEVRARRQHARPVQGPRRGQRADRRARVPRPAEGRNAQRLDRHRLPLVRHPDARAQGLLPGLPRQVQGLPAPGLGGRLQHDQVGRGRHRQGQEHRHRPSWSRPSRACRSTRPSARSPTAPKTTSRPWAPSSARRRTTTARA